MRSKMIPPIPESGESDHDRFKRFAKAILGVPKSEITTTTTVAVAMKQKLSRTLHEREKPVKQHRGRDANRK